MNDPFETAKEMTKQRARSFYFASHVLDEHTRRAAFATYAFCRRADDAVDGAGDKAAALSTLEREVDAVYLGQKNNDPLLEAFRETVIAFRVPESAVRGLLQGMRWDLEGRTYVTWEDTLAYCELAAGTVGRMMAALFRAKEDVYDCAAALGRAMQLTNIVRDVKEDLLELDRVYLPEEALSKVGLSRSDLKVFADRGGLFGPKGDRFRGIVDEALGIADRLYRTADRGLLGIPSRRARASTALMRASYCEIGRVIQANGGDVFGGRAVVSTPRKVRVGARALVETRYELFMP